MENAKYQSMLQRLNNKEFEGILYVNFFGDDSMFIYPLKTIIKGLEEGTIKTQEMVMNKTTAVYKGKTSKLVILLDASLASKFKKVDGRWMKE